MAKPNQEVEVPLAKVRLFASKFVKLAFAPVKFWANRFVLVVLVPVAFVQIRLVKLEGAAPVMLKVWKMALVAYRFVEVALVDVTLVNTPDDGVSAPMLIPFIVPPVKVTFPEFKLVPLRLRA